MKESLCVSILVLTYKPNLDKIKRTLKSIFNQKGVEYEIIISDDGSKEDCAEEIKKIFLENNFENYIFNKNQVNVGTVKNYLSALNVANGQYIYATSPGDLLYDEYVIRDFYEYASQNDIKICFGDAIYYNTNANGLVLFSGYFKPAKPFLYTAKHSINTMKASFFFDDNVIMGASYFRERKSAIKYAEILQNYAKYAEDITTAFALMDNTRVQYFNRRMMYYEYGNGISTQKNTEWDNRLKEDYSLSYNAFNNYYPNDRFVDIINIGNRYESKVLVHLLQVVKHPLITLNLFYCKMFSKTKNIYTENDKSNLKKILE